MTNTTVDPNTRSTVRRADRITVGVDFSLESAIALNWALREAVLREVPCEVIYAWSPRAVVLENGWAIDPGWPDDDLRLHRQLTALVAGIAEDVAPKVDVRVTVVPGAAADVLSHDPPDDGLLVVGTRGRSALREAMLGSVSEACMHHVQTPLVIVPRVLSSTTGRIVAGVDGSPASARALAWAAKEAVHRNAELVVTHAWRIPAVAANPYVPIVIDPAVYRRAGGMVLEHALAPLPSLDRVQNVLVPGPAAPALVDASKDADLLVIGADGHGAVTGGLLGSVTQRCARRAHCPVVVIR